MSQYRVVLAQSGKKDIKERKKYILFQFKYRQLAENFSKKMKKALLSLDTLPAGYESTDFEYRGYNIYYKPYQTYLLFFVINENNKVVTVLRILQDGQNWKYIISRWIRQNK